MIKWLCIVLAVLAESNVSLFLNGISVFWNCFLVMCLPTKYLSTHFYVTHYFTITPVLKVSNVTLAGSVKIPVHDLSGRHNSERWHPLEGGEVTGGASLRAKCRYQSLEVLPCRHYQPLLLFLRDNYSQLVEYLEPVIGEWIIISIHTSSSSSA